MSVQLSKEDTFTSQNIIDAYCSAYYGAHGKHPARIVHLGGKWFRVETEMRDRKWLITEISRMREDALQQADEKKVGSKRFRLMRIIRGLSKSVSNTLGNGGNNSNADDDKDQTIMRRNQVKAAAAQVARPAERTHFQFGPNDTLLLQLSGESIAIQGPSTLIVGRDESLRDKGIDLTHFDAEEMGVSRKHAQIHHVSASNYLEIVDLGSVNGTYLNGQMLSPLQAYPLYDGDTVNLGSLVVQVRFMHARV